MKKRPFSLIEVVIATMILAMAAVVTAEMLSRTHTQSYEAGRDWQQQHQLAMGCEFYLLFGHEAEFPAENLAENYSLSCELLSAEIPEDAEEEKYEAISGWVLGEYTIRLFLDGEEVESAKIVKLVPQDLL